MHAVLSLDNLKYGIPTFDQYTSIYKAFVVE